MHLKHVEALYGAKQSERWVQIGSGREREINTPSPEPIWSHLPLIIFGIQIQMKNNKYNISILILLFFYYTRE